MRLYPLNLFFRKIAKLNPRNLHSAIISVRKVCKDCRFSIERKSQTRLLSTYEATMTCSIPPKCDSGRKRKRPVVVFEFSYYCCCGTLVYQGRSQPFCMEGFLMYIACPIDNRAPEALFTRGVRGRAPPENF